MVIESKLNITAATALYKTNSKIKNETPENNNMEGRNLIQQIVLLKQQ
jgi:hypothetical protein